MRSLPLMPAVALLVALSLLISSHLVACESRNSEYEIGALEEKISSGLDGAEDTSMDWKRDVLLSAVDVDLEPTQIAALKAISTAHPALKTMPNGAWSDSQLRHACRDPGYIAGILNCDPNGFITVMELPNAIGTTDVATISEAISNLTKLYSLGSGSLVVLTGNVPSSWTSLAEMRTLQLLSSRFTGGGIPVNWGIFWPNIMSLMMGFNPANVQPAAPDWPQRVTTLNLYGLNLGTNAIPNAWFSSSTSSITMLTLTACYWQSFTFPTPLLSNTKMVNIRLTFSSDVHAMPSSAFPSRLSGMTALTNLVIYHFPWTTLPSNLQFPPKLTYIILSGGKNTLGQIPTNLFNLPLIAHIEFYGFPNFTGNIPGPTNPTNSKLDYIAIYDMKGLDGQISQTIMSPPLLAYIMIQGPFPLLQPSTFPPVNPTTCALQMVYVRSIQNQLSGTLPSNLPQLCPKIYIFDVRENNLTGSFPQDWSYTNKLITVAAQNNSFLGQLPTELFGTLQPLCCI